MTRAPPPANIQMCAHTHISGVKQTARPPPPETGTGHSIHFPVNQVQSAPLCRQKKGRERHRIPCEMENVWRERSITRVAPPSATRCKAENVVRPAAGGRGKGTRAPTRGPAFIITGRWMWPIKQPPLCCIDATRWLHHWSRLPQNGIGVMWPYRWHHLFMKSRRIVLALVPRGCHIWF